MLHDFRLDSNHVLLGAPNQIRITNHPISHPPSSSQHLAFISTIQQGYFSNNQTYTHTIAASIKPETLYHHSRNCVAIIRPQPPNKENATKHTHTHTMWIFCVFSTLRAVEFWLSVLYISSGAIVLRPSAALWLYVSFQMQFKLCKN